MTPIYQEADNCLACCIAGILDVDLSSVPEFEENIWQKQVDNFVFNFGYIAIWDYSLTVPFDNLAIGVGPSPRGPWTHAVIIDNNYQIVHDPYEGGEPMESLDYAIILT